MHLETMVISSVALVV